MIKSIRIAYQHITHTRQDFAGEGTVRALEVDRIIQRDKGLQQLESSLAMIEKSPRFTLILLTFLGLIKPWRFIEALWS
jgi:hypothetical protein